MEKADLECLRFTVWTEAQATGEALCSGTYREVVKYLQDNGADNLVVAALDLENSFSFDPIPANKWLEWYDYMVIPALKENDWSDDLRIEYPDAGMDLNINDES